MPTTSNEVELQEFPADGNPHRQYLRVKEHVERQIRQLLNLPAQASLPAGMQETPSRVARCWINELTSGYEIDVASLFRDFPDEGYQGQVVVKDIPVTSVCEHHMLPIVGVAHIGYFPAGRIIGLSKLPRVVNAYARRFQVQERLTQQIVDAIETNLKPSGTIVVIEAEHTCTTLRGIQAPGTKTVTCTVTGRYIKEQGTKEEFLELVKNGGHS